MRIFFSHSSRDKPLLREIRTDLPKKIDAWIDERDLTLGEKVIPSLKKAIISDSDYLVIFISPEAVASKWVRQELIWALDHEKSIGRIFVLPVVLDLKSWCKLPEEIRSRKYISCLDFTSRGVKRVAKELGDELFSLLTQKLDDSNERDLTLQHEEDRHRKNQVRRLANQISDVQQSSHDKGYLSRERIDFIVSSLDREGKIQLLLLFETTFGRFAEIAAKKNMAKVRSVEIVLKTKQGIEWPMLMNFEESGFRHIQVDYGLGSKTEYVRKVFLLKLSSLDQTERNELFCGMEIVDCTFHRW